MDAVITIQVQPKARRIKLQIVNDGEVLVTTPPHLPKFIINRFIADHQEWINKHSIKHKGKLKVLTTTYIYLFGTKYDLIYSNDTADSPGFVLTQDKLLYTPIAGKTIQMNHKLLNNFLKSTCSAYILPRTHQLAKNMNVSFNTIGFKEQKTRWGSCSSRGTLSFNWRLVHFEPSVIDYVITHELAHLVHPNHSRAFWKLVSQHFPNLASAKKTLQQYYW